MIEQLRLENFQSHADTTLEFHPGINAITGDSDKGKSAVLRGLLWAVENNPQGDAHVSDWIKTEKGTIKARSECRVTAIKRNGGCARIRSGTMNGYQVHDRTLEAIRTDVPPEVAEFFNLGEVNIQRQMDRPFLISYPPGEAARFLNRLVNLTDIDLAMTAVEAKKRDAKKSITQSSEAVDRVRDLVDGLAWVDSLAPKVARLREMFNARSRLTNQIHSLGESLREYRERGEESFNLALVVEKVGDNILRAQGYQGAISRLNRTMTSGESTLSQYLTADAEASRLREVIAGAGPLLSEAQGIGPRVSALKVSAEALGRSIPEYEMARKVCENAEAVSDAARDIQDATRLSGKIAFLESMCNAVRIGLAEVRKTDCAALREVVELSERKLGRASRMTSTIGELAKALEIQGMDLASFRRASEDAGRLRAEIDEIQSQFRVCPTCGQAWPEGHAHA